VEFLAGFDDFRHVQNLRRTSDRLQTVATGLHCAKVDQVQKTAENVGRYFRVFDFDSRVFEVVIRPEVDDGIEEITALRQQLRHVGHEDCLVIDVDLQIVIKTVPIQDVHTLIQTDELFRVDVAMLDVQIRLYIRFFDANEKLLLLSPPLHVTLDVSSISAVVFVLLPRPSDDNRLRCKRDAVAVVVIRVTRVPSDVEVSTLTRRISS